MELISREEVLKRIDEMILVGSGEKDILAKISLAFKTGMIENIEGMPTIESRPTGKWIADSTYFQAFNETVTTYKCSECQGEPYFSTREGIEIYKFCPFCGADMRGEIE